jgi:membrane-bound lytic murein transglycosylase D
MGRSEIVVLLALAVMGAGCDHAAKKPIRAAPPVIQQEPAAAPAPLPAPPPRAPVPEALPSPQKAVEALLEKAAAAFLSGEQNYKAGHLEKARRDFDRAVDMLLESGVDLHSDRRLEQLFDRMVTAIHNYETAAFRDGDGFSEQRSEPAAIDEIAELTFPTDPRLKETAERVLHEVPHDLPLVVNEHVLSYLNFFQTPRGRAIVERGLARAGRYREMISRVLREEGLPQDLIYLAQAESAFQPHAVSRMRAVGLWQFMSYTGRDYGLRTTWWTDDRRDPEKATRAAARHLKDLYGEFNDWLLAMAAYNTGNGGVQRAIQRTGYADFWELYTRNVLPRETRNYVPIILALALIAKDPARYGITVLPELPLETDRIKPGHPIDLRLVAETVETNVETLKLLNPHLLRMVTPADPGFELHLPLGTASRFYSEIASIPEDKWVLWRRHRIEEGDTLSGLAKTYRVSTSAIAEANGLEPRAALRVGEKLIIPATVAASEQGKLTRYRVRRGDTLPSIAEQFSVTVEELKEWNRIVGSKVTRGVTLRVYPGGRPPAPARARATRPAAPAATAPARTAATAPANGDSVTHRVRAGETLWSIARAYQTTIEALRASNQFLLTRQLRVGDQLVIVPR